jgi:hypothetical protein
MMPISEIRERVSQGLLDFTWRQWAQAGVSASVTGSDQWAIDPEALILFTIGIAQRDPRLFDELLDWIALNHGLLSMQRLRNLTGRFPVNPSLVAAVIAWTRQPVPAQLLRDRGQASSSPGTEPVFNRDVLGFIAQSDPTFEEFGFTRPHVVRSGKSREPDVRLSANLAFQLRHLFGPGSRSEIIRVLLTYADGPLDAARTADEVGFSKRNTSEALTALAASGVIKASWSGNERHFTASRDRWSGLLGKERGTGLPSFVPWTRLLPAALEITIWLDTQARTTESEYLVASRARSLMDRVSRNLEMSGIEVPRDEATRGPDYLPVLADASQSLLTRLGIGEPAG